MATMKDGTQVDAELRAIEMRDVSYRKWMAQPTVRMLLSVIPPGERPEVLEGLLKDAFESGFTAGAGAFVMDLMMTMMHDRKPST